MVEPNQQDYNWYHRQFRRVPTLDECFIDDPVCIYEADSQFRRDRLVDSEIVNILRMRLENCVKEEYPDISPCAKLKEDLFEAEGNWFCKCRFSFIFFGVISSLFSLMKPFSLQMET